MAAGIALCIGGGVGIDGLLCLAPALLLVLTLLGRRYPGERLLLATRANRRGGRDLTARHRVHPAHRRADARVPRGGLLIAFALAVRPPPAASAAS
jgi:hypothetical protein